MTVQDPRVEVGVCITHAWQEKDPLGKGLLTKYRLVDRDGRFLGIFRTPPTSELSTTLCEQITIRKRKNSKA